MAYCPNCGAELAPDAVRCTHCPAIFDANWKPLAELPVPQPPRPPEPEPLSRGERIAAASAKIILAMLGLAMLFIGGLVAAAEKGSLWLAACVLTGFAVLAVAIQARLRWSFLMLFIAVAVGFTSCAANFKWHGG